MCESWLWINFHGVIRYEQQLSCFQLVTVFPCFLMHQHHAYCWSSTWQEIGSRLCLLISKRFGLLTAFDDMKTLFTSLSSRFTWRRAFLCFRKGSPGWFLVSADVFWVFASPSVIGENVMLTVATSDVLSGPTKILFPRHAGSVGEASAFPFSLLGKICVVSYLLRWSLLWVWKNMQNGLLKWKGWNSIWRTILIAYILTTKTSMS